MMMMIHRQATGMNERTNKHINRILIQTRNQSHTMSANVTRLVDVLCMDCKHRPHRIWHEVSNMKLSVRQTDRSASRTEDKATTLGQETNRWAATVVQITA